MKSPFEFKQHGQTRPLGEQRLSAPGRLRGRYGLPHGDDDEDQRPRPGQLHDEHRLHAAGLPLHGRLDLYGLGSLTDNLPSFVVLPDGRGLPVQPEGQLQRRFPARPHQGTIIEPARGSPSPICSPTRAMRFVTAGGGARWTGAAGKAEPAACRPDPADSRLEARIPSYELAAKMQLSAPEAFDLSRESRSDANGLRHRTSR